MYARLVTGTMEPNNLDEAIRLWRDSVAPSVKVEAGFRSTQLLIERRNGRIASIGFWDQAMNVQESESWNQEQLAKFMDLFTTPPLVGHYEIVAEA